MSNESFEFSTQPIDLKCPSVLAVVGEELWIGGEQIQVIYADGTTTTFGEPNERNLFGFFTVVGNQVSQTPISLISTPLLCIVLLMGDHWSGGLSLLVCVMKIETLPPCHPLPGEKISKEDQTCLVLNVSIFSFF